MREIRLRRKCPSPSLARDSEVMAAVTQLGPQPTVGHGQWQLGVDANHAQFFTTACKTFCLPWETGVFAGIFGHSNLLELPMKPVA